VNDVQRRRSHLATGTVLVVAAEGVALPVALLLSAFVTRRLGPSGYGLYALAATIVAWVEWTVASVLSRAIVREASAGGDHDALGAAAIQLNALLGIGAWAGLWLLAPAVAALTREPALISPLRVLALDVPLFTVAMAHRSLLVGHSAYRARAVLPIVRWIGRLVLVVGLVQLGWSLNGVVLGCLGASVIELVVARAAVHPPILRRPDRMWARLMSDALPFLALGVTLRLFDRIDLLMFKVFGGTTAGAGLYGAAQSVAMALAVLSIAFPPLLLATLTRLYAAGERVEAAALASQSLRVVCWLLPLVGLAAGAGPEIAAMLFGRAFESAGPLLAPLIVASVAQVLIAVVIMTLSASGLPNLFLLPGASMVAVAIAGGAFAIPRFGAMGAALVAAATGCAGAGVALWLAWRRASVAPPLWALGRATAATVAAGVACHVSVEMLPLGWALGLGALAAGLVLLLSGELRAAELRNIGRLFRQSPSGELAGEAR
jgi:O-antigen/teichoic acid export membrane protein